MAKRAFSFLDLLQNGYNRLLDFCFAHPRIIIGSAVVSVAIGIYMMGVLPQRLLPTAERNQFAVEIYMPTGTAVERTAQVADSLEHLLRKDSRVVSVASFKGCGSPRFQNSYAPQMGGTNFAQIIVNTTGNEETVALLDEYAPRYREMFPEAVIRFKQLNYSEAVCPIEVRLSRDSLGTLQHEAKRVGALLRTITVIAATERGVNAMEATAKVKQLVEENPVAHGVTVSYGGELEENEEQMHVREAIYHSAKRRMRPIFLTSAAASMGVVPMILGKSSLWMPMGTVIFYGTLITMFFILTVIPVAYWKIMAGNTKRRMENEQMEKE